MKRSSSLTIGVLANQAGVGVETVRFYERKGLIQKPLRQAGRYRNYTAEDTNRIHFIKRAQELGFTLKEVKELLDLNANPKATCSDIKKKTDLKISEVKAKIKDLQKMEQALKELAKACGESKKEVSQCHVTECFEDGWKC